MNDSIHLLREGDIMAKNNNNNFKNSSKNSSKNSNKNQSKNSTKNTHAKVPDSYRNSGPGGE